MTNLLITGASGFIGKALYALLTAEACNTEYGSIGVAVRLPTVIGEGTVPFVVGDIDATTDWTEALHSVDAVVHLAARVHVMRDDTVEPLAVFRKVNVDGTMNLVRQAAQAGVRRFIFISSIKVNGEFTLPDNPFSAEDIPAPVDPYAISKYEAEQALREFADKTTMEFVIIRPPLVYGSGVKANFYTMMRWLDNKIPLPLGAIDNRRSLLALDNLVDLIRLCIKHPAAANQVFLVADGDDMSTTQLLHRVAVALGKNALLLPVPVYLLMFVARLFNKTAAAQRLCCSLQVDISKAHRLLGWIPPVSVNDALAKTAQDYIKNR